MSDRRQTVLELLAEGHRLVEGINAHMVEIEALLDITDEGDSGSAPGSDRNGGGRDE